MSSDYSGGSSDEDDDQILMFRQVCNLIHKLNFSQINRLRDVSTTSLLKCIARAYQIIVLMQQVHFINAIEDVEMTSDINSVEDFITINGPLLKYQINLIKATQIL